MAHIRKHLCADALISSIRELFKAIPHPRSRNGLSMADILMSGYAVFSLKYASLLAFQRDYRCSDMPDPQKSNMKSLFGIVDVPSDTYMREIIDEVAPESFRPAFKSLFSKLQRGNELNQYRYLNDKYLISMDGTGLFSSKEVHCESCMVKHNSKTGEKTYYHQMLGMVMVHPEIKAVVPFCPEPILKQDGANKNDSERNAAKRGLEKLRQDHPKLKAIILEDGLASNAPHLRFLKELDFSFIIAAKPGDHKHLFEQASLAGAARHSLEIEGSDQRIHKFHYLNHVSLNESNEDLKVNFIDYEEHDLKTGKCIKFSWVTDLEINDQNIMKIMRAGRSRWRIENETFNTLKNQGYNFEHNYGHGEKNLCTNFALLMFLAFAVDQIQLLACREYQEARSRFGAFYQFCDRVLGSFQTFIIPNWSALLQYLANPFMVPIPQGPP